MLKKCIALITLFFVVDFAYAQSGTGIYLQAVARDIYANPAKDRKIYVKTSIIQSTPSGNVVLMEEFQTQTDAIGIFGISIGLGNRVGGTKSSLESIDWANGPYFLNMQVAISPLITSSNWDYTKEWNDLGTSPFGTVPYAMHSGTVTGWDKKLSITDTAKMLSYYAKLGNLNTLLTTKVNLSDSTTLFVTPTQLNAKTFDTTSISNRINSKANLSELIDVTNNITSITNNVFTNTNSITSLINSVNSNTSSITSNENAIILKANIASPIFSGVVTAPSFVKNGGLSTQYLMADGSVTTGAGSVNLGTGVTGILPIDKGGTGQTTVSGILSTLGFASNNIVIGANAAQNNQGAYSVAIGYAAGQNNQGAYSVAIGSNAGNSQVANSIAINATGNNLNPTNAGFYVSPIRSSTSTSNILYYNTSTNEIVSSSPSFVDLTTDQTIAGNKTFNSNVNVNGVSIGRGLGNNSESVAIGPSAMGNSNINGKRNTAIGYAAMGQYNGTSWDNNTSIGYNNLPRMTSGSGNTSVGAESMLNLLTGTSNTSIGNQSLINVTGSNNVGVGKRSGQTISTGSQNTMIGTDADVTSSNLTNATALGYGAIATANNSVQLGNLNVANVKTSGTITAGVVTYPNSDGVNGQVLTTNGSGVLSWVNASGGITTIGSIAGTANSNGATVSSGVLSLTPADATYGGVVTNGAQSFAGTKTFDAIKSKGAITGSAAISNEITSSITINAANASTYNGNVLICNPSSAMNITIDNSTTIPTGFNFMVVQKSASSNRINFIAGTSSTIVNRSGNTATAGQYAMATLVHIGNGIFVTSGDMQ